MKLPSYLTRRGWVYQDDRLVPGSSSNGTFAPQDDQVETLLDAMGKAGLQVLVQHRDPKSGWVHLMGPSMFYELWPDRYIVALGAWDRSLPTLDFRAIRADGQVVEFFLPNPDLHKSPSAGTPKALPFIHHAADYTLTVNRVERFTTPGDHPFAAVDMHLQYTGPSVRGLKSGPISLDSVPGGAVDEWGNVVDFERETIRKESRFGGCLPAASRRMALTLPVRRTVNYPRHANEGFVVLEGEVSADGRQVDFKAGPDAALFGIQTMPSGRIKATAPAWRGKETKDWKDLELEIAGGNGASELDAIQNRIGDVGQWQFPIFVGEGDESAGLSSGGRSGGYGQGGGKFHFHRMIDWYFPPELLAPGAKIRVGAQRPIGDDELSFDLELPEKVETR